MVEGFFFEANDIRRFAIAHRPAEPSTNVGVVLCHPYGEEKQFSYPVLRRFGLELERIGIPALRFDGCGYGDSEGEMEDSTVESQIEEALLLSRLAKDWLQVDRIALLGLRFGGTIAALAAAREPGFEALILWSPIVSGAAYVNELLRKKLMAEMLGPRGGSTREQILEELDREGRVEIEGNYLSRRMSSEISAIDLPEQLGGFQGPVFLSAIESERSRQAGLEALASAYRANGAACSLRIADDEVFWEKGAMYKSYLPIRLLEETRGWLQNLKL